MKSYIDDKLGILNDVFYPIYWIIIEAVKG